MNHPLVERVMRTGYMEEPECQVCTHCNDEFYTHEGYKFDDEMFCSSACIGEYLIEQGEAKKIA